MKLAMLLNPTRTLQQASEFLSTFWYESVKNLRHYSKMERESTFFLKAHQEESFQRYHLWFKNFEQQLKQLYKKLKQPHSVEILKDMNEIFASQSTDFSPLYYEMSLKKIAHDFPRYATMFKHFSQQLENYFKENPELAFEHFYQDIKNHLVFMAGNKISKEVLVEQLSLSFYSKIIPADLYQSVLALLGNFNPTYCESETNYPYKWIASYEIENLIAQIEATFLQFEETENIQNLPEENHQATTQSYSTSSVAIGTLLITSSLYYLFIQGGGKNSAISNLSAGMMNFENMIATGVISYLSVIAERTHSLPIKIAMVSLPLFTSAAAQSSTTNGPYGDTQFIQLLNGGVLDQGCCGWQTADNGYFAVGTTSSFGQDSGVLLTKWDPNGDLIWAKTFGGSNSSVEAAQPTTDGGCVITGFTYVYGKAFSSIFIAKLDENATVSWFKTITGPSFAWGPSVQQTWDGNYVIGGSMYMENSLYSVLVAKLDSDGTFLWIKAFAGAGNNQGYWIEETSDRGYIVTGMGGVPANAFLLVKLGVNGTITWAKELPGEYAATGLCVQQTSDEGFIISGESASYYNPQQRRDLLLIKVDRNGNFLWGNTWNITENNAGNSAGSSVQETVDKDYIVAGATSAATIVGNKTVYYGNVLLTKWYENGTFSWSKAIEVDPDVPRVDLAHSVQQLPNEDYLVTGRVNGSLLLARLDSEGNCANCPALQSVTPNVTPRSYNFVNTTLIESDILSNVTLGSWTVNQTFVTYPTIIQLCPLVSTTGLLTTSFNGATTADSSSSLSSGGINPLLIIGPIGGVLVVSMLVFGIYRRRNEISGKLKECYEKRLSTSDDESARIPLLPYRPSPTPQPPPLIQLPSAKIEMKRGELQKKHELGRGVFGTVYFGVWKQTKKSVAIKELKLLPEDTFQVEQFRKEIEVMVVLRHPNVIILWGICSREAPYWIVMEYMSNGSLDKALKNPEWNWNNELKIKVAKGITYGLAYLHSSEIIHRDLKSQNILLDENKEPKIADFGTSKMDSWIKQTLRGGLYGTPTHMAPEVFDAKPATAESDMYSYGMVLWEIVAQKSPYEHHPDVTSKDMNLFSFRALIMKGIREKIPEKCQPDFEELIKQCWEQNPVDRPTAEEAAQQLEAIKIDENLPTVPEEKTTNENKLPSHFTSNTSSGKEEKRDDEPEEALKNNKKVKSKLSQVKETSHQVESKAKASNESKQEIKDVSHDSASKSEVKIDIEQSVSAIVERKDSPVFSPISSSSSRGMDEQNNYSNSGDLIRQSKK